MIACAGEIESGTEVGGDFRRELGECSTDFRENFGIEDWADIRIGFGGVTPFGAGFFDLGEEGGGCAGGLFLIDVDEALSGGLVEFEFFEDGSDFFKEFRVEDGTFGEGEIVTIGDDRSDVFRRSRFNWGRLNWGN